MKTLSFIFSTLLLLTIQVNGQAQSEQDTVKQPLRLTGIRVGVDVVHPILTFAKSDFSGWEVIADAEFRNYYPVVEIGRWSRDVSLSNGQYQNSGNYFRAGVDVNLLKKDPVKNMFFLGIRYGNSFYSEQLDYTITTKEFGLVTKSLSNNNLHSGWAEIVTGMRVKIRGGFWMGYTGRIKFAASLDKNNQLQSYDVPGYGLTFKKPWWGFNYYLMWKVNFKRKV